MTSVDPAASAPWDLLARELAGEASAADSATVSAWAAADPAHAALWAQLRGVWAEAGAPLAAGAGPFGPTDTARAWQHFEANVLGPPPALPQASAPPVPPGAAPVAGFVKMTGLLVVGLGAGWLLRTAIPPTTESTSQIPEKEAIITQAPSTINAQSPSVDLIFENTPVRTVARRIEDTFAGIHVEIADSLVANQQFTGTFRAAQPGAVLRVVGLTTGATLSQRPDSTWVLTRAAN